MDALSAKAGRPLGVLAALAASLMLGACAQTGDDGGLFAALTPESAEQAAKDAAPSDPQAATDYWGKLYSKDPRDLEAALAYAHNLKVIGKKREALAVLQQASLIHGTNRKLAADYGRLALELDQISVAKKLLEVADDPGSPDWRIILARGTALAKEGSYREAIGFYERAQALNPGHPSVLNNLALAYTMSGEPERGEQLLRQASTTGTENAKVRQNLALVLGLQGKYDEATQIASVDLAPAEAEANTAMLKKMVKLDAKAAPPAPASDPIPAAWPSEPPAMVSWAPSVAEAPAQAKVQARAKKAAPTSTAAAAEGSGLRKSTIETGFGGASASSQAASLFSAE